MIYNTGHRFLKRVQEISQEDIWNCPEFFACSYDEIVAHPECTAALKQALDEYPWSGRPNVIQVRPQDWTKGRPSVLGDGWHIDVNVRLADGIQRNAKSMDDWRLLVCSWGDVCGTDFMARPMDLPDATPPFDYGTFFRDIDKLESRGIPIGFVTAAPGELWEYTSRDIHRVSAVPPNLGRVRLMIVAFECDDVPAKGMHFPSLAQRGGVDFAKGFTG